MKLLSRNVIIDENDQGLSIVTLRNGKFVCVEPFVAEKPGVSFTDKTIVVNSTDFTVSLETKKRISPVIKK